MDLSIHPISIGTCILDHSFMACFEGGILLKDTTTQLQWKNYENKHKMLLNNNETYNSTEDVLKELLGTLSLCRAPGSNGIHFVLIVHGNERLHALLLKFFNVFGSAKVIIPRA